MVCVSDSPVRGLLDLWVASDGYASVGMGWVRGVARQNFPLWLCAPLVPSLSEQIGFSLFYFVFVKVPLHDGPQRDGSNALDI